MKFSLKQMQAFLAVVQHGSTLSAARELGISQPAISSALAGLEAKLDTRLFYRWKKRMILSERGRSLLPMARRLVDNARELDQMFATSADHLNGVLRLGASRTLASYVIPRILAAFSTHQPGVKIEVVSRNKAGVLAMIEDFSLDLGVIAGTGDKADIKSYPWLTDELCVFCSAAHPLAKKKVITWEDLGDSQWILREEGSGTLEIFQRALIENILPLNVAMTLDNLESIKRTVEHMHVLSCVSRFAIQREVDNNILAILHTPFLQLTRNYSFITHREKQHSQLLSYFINHCLHDQQGH